MYRCSERNKRKLRQLKMLLPEGYSDYRYAEQCPTNQVGQGQHQPAEDDPDNIQDKASGTAAIYYLTTKRPQGKPCQFESLQPYRDADYRNTTEYPGDNPAKSQ